MTISADYPRPVTVNGFACHNCTEVDEAKKHIDPARPKDGPYGVNARSQPAGTHGPAVQFGGALAGLSQASTCNRVVAAQAAGRLDLSV